MPSSFALAESLGSRLTCSFCSGSGEGVRLRLDLPPSAMMRLGSTPRRFFLTFWSAGGPGWAVSAGLSACACADESEACSAAGSGCAGECGRGMAGMAVERWCGATLYGRVEKRERGKARRGAAGIC